MQEQAGAPQMNGGGGMGNGVTAGGMGDMNAMNGTGGMGTAGGAGTGGLADMMGAGGMNMPLNSVGGALQVLDFMMQAMPSKNSGRMAPGGMVPTSGVAGAPVSNGQYAPAKKPMPVVGGVGSTMNRSVNRGINRGINSGVNRAVGRSMRYIHF
jgi:hypothetical protein